jgi:hypothetical protein
MKNNNTQPKTEQVISFTTITVAQDTAKKQAKEKKTPSENVYKRYSFNGTIGGYQGL